MPVFILLIKTVQVKNLFMGQEVSPESTFKTAGDKTNFQKVAISPQEITIIDQNGYTWGECGQKLGRIAEAREKLQLDEMLWWWEEGQMRGWDCMCGLWTVGERGPCLTSAAATEIIPPIIQDVFL